MNGKPTKDCPECFGEGIVHGDKINAHGPYAASWVCGNCNGLCVVELDELEDSE